MIQFIKDSFRELKHVVWPTRKETQKFFGLVLGLIIIFGIYLFVFSQAFSEILFTLKERFGTGQSQSQMIDIDTDSIFLNEEDFVEDEVLFDEVGEDLDITIDGEENGEMIDNQELGE